MEHYYCKNLINCLSFHQKNVRFCTTLQLGQLISTYQENAEELAKKISDLRHEINENLKQGIIPEGCKDCIYKITMNYLNTQKTAV